MLNKIKKVAVLGSGVMGSGIACHLANAGMEVLMLDILPGDLNEININKKSERNRIADNALKSALKSKPSPIFDKSISSRISIGNFEDDLDKLKDYEWIIEVIVENPEIKIKLFEKIDNIRKPGTYITSNTSGIPINYLANHRSDDFKKHFLGVHFFNPPRYLQLIELIPNDETSKETLDFFTKFGDVYLGKLPVICKDSPGFIANRIGLFSMALLMELTEKYGFSIELVDQLTGSAIGRPSTGTFRLMDLVGIDVADKVLKSLIENLPEDKFLQTWKTKPLPKYFTFLLENKFLGDKTAKGYYTKTNRKDEKGKSIISALDIKTLEYNDQQKISSDFVRNTKKIDNLKSKIIAIFDADNPEANFLKEYFLHLFSYVSHRIPEISDNLYSCDIAMCAGYGWDAGAFEIWEMIGVQRGIELAENQGHKIAEWVKDMLNGGNISFYVKKNNAKYCYDLFTKNYAQITGQDNYIILDNFSKESIIYKNTEAVIRDIGDGVMNVEFISKSNVIGEGTGEAMMKAIEIAENEGWKGVVIGNNSKNFSVGANLMMVAMFAYQKNFDKLNQLTNDFQQANMRLRYSKIPVVIATQGFTFGGGCEMSMHADSVIAAGESYIGLVEVGVGLLPGGGGTKEFALRHSESIYQGNIVMNRFIDYFKTIATGQVATSGLEAFSLGYLDHQRDKMVMNTLSNINEAKKKVLQLADDYIMPDKKSVLALGRTGLATLYAAINEFKLGKFISEYDAHIARKIAYVMCGGDLTGEQIVNEQFLLDIEREAFLSLLGEQKTLDRIQYMLENNKPLRN